VATTPNHRQAADPLHESDVRNSAIVGRKPMTARFFVVLAPSARAIGLATDLLPDRASISKSHVGSRRFRDEQRPDQFEDELLFAAYLLQEVHGRADGASLGDAEHESTPVAHREFVGHAGR
jgi:hypothetical protein